MVVASHGEFRGTPDQVYLSRRQLINKSFTTRQRNEDRRRAFADRADYLRAHSAAADSQSFVGAVAWVSR